MLAGVLLLAWGALFLYTERALAGTDFPASADLPKGDPVSSERLARIHGFSGCHGRQLQGQVFADIPHVARLIAPNLTKARDQYDQHAFVRLMRAGTKADGRLALVMPNQAHQRLTDQQLADLEAYMHSVPAGANALPFRRIRTLLVARAYSDHRFLRLLHQGKTLAGTESASGLMSEVARSRFSVLSADEVAAIKDVLDR